MKPKTITLTHPAPKDPDGHFDFAAHPQNGVGPEVYGDGCAIDRRGRLWAARGAHRITTAGEYDIWSGSDLWRRITAIRRALCGHSTGPSEAEGLFDPALDTVAIARMRGGKPWCVRDTCVWPEEEMILKLRREEAIYMDELA